MSDAAEKRSCFRCQRSARWKIERIVAGTYRNQKPIQDVTRRWLACGVHLHTTCEFVFKFQRTVSVAVTPFPTPENVEEPT